MAKSAFFYVDDEIFNLTKVAIFISTGWNSFMLSINTSLLTYWPAFKRIILKKWFKITWLPQETREFSTGLFQTPRNCCSQIKQNKGLFVDESTHAGGTSLTKIIFSIGLITVRPCQISGKIREITRHSLEQYNAIKRIKTILVDCTTRK